MLDTGVRTTNVAQAQTAPASPPVNASRVDDAVNSIRDDLKQESFLGVQHNDVSQDDLRSINDTLSGLTGAERQEVISRLSDGELNTWTDEIDNGGFLGMGGGLSADERRDLHDTLASSLDGAQLERVYNAYDGKDQRLELASAIATHGTTDAKVDFVRGLADQTEGAGDSSIAGTAQLTDFNVEGRAVAEVLGSLKGNPAGLRDGFAALNDEQLRGVFAAAAEPFTSSSMGATGYGFDTQPLARMVDAAASSSDADLKARVFTAAGEQVKFVSASDDSVYATNPNAEADAATIRDSMTRLLDSDIRGVVGSLEGSDPYGRALTGYLREMTDTDQGQKVGQQLAELGKDINATAPVENDPATAADNDLRYPNAELLGYFSGSIQAGIRASGADAQKQASVTEDIFMSVLDVIPGGGNAGAVARGLGKGLTRATVNVVTDSIAQGTADLRESFYKLSFPQGAGAAENSYRTWESSVLTAN